MNRILPCYATHFKVGLQACTKGWTLWQAKNLATLIGIKLRAGYASGFTVWHARDGAVDAWRGATSATMWATIH